MGLQFDHIAIGCTDLAEGTAWVEEQLGVALRPGGKHVQFGTYNTLLGMGDLYLEVIAKDPDAPAIDRPTWFDLDNFVGSPRLTNWICRSDDIEKEQAITGPALSLLIATATRRKTGDKRTSRLSGTNLSNTLFTGR